jgi:hypothetical protein
MADRPKQAPREEHLGDTRAQVRFVLWLVGPFGGLGLILWLAAPGFLGTIGGILVVAALAALAFYFMSLGIQAGVAGPLARGFGRLLLPSGSSTPGPKPLSHIEAMEARGELDKAAAAYKAEIATDPIDVTSCERLGVLAQRRLHDYPLAAWAYREAERRADTPARKYGYGLLAVGVYRDLLKDRGRTLVELRRLVEQYPTAPQVDALRAEIEHLRAELFEGSDA